jgi:galactose mutarotase-like enzyme
MRLENESVAVEVLPEHGMTITALEASAGGPNVLWQRHRHQAPACSRALGPAGERSNETLHDLLLGGWFEMSPLAGMPGRLDGRETHLHGEAARLPWRVADRDGQRLEATVRTVVDGLYLRRGIELVGSTVRTSSTIANRGARAVAVTHGEHPCFSRAVFGGGALRLEARTSRVLEPLDPTGATLGEGGFEWPRAGRRDGTVDDLSRISAAADGAHDHVAIELASPTVQLESPAGLRLTLEIDLARHPYLLLWRNHGAPGAPGFGEWDVFALEPMSAPGRSIEDAVEAGAVVRLESGGQVSYSFSINEERIR